MISILTTAVNAILGLSISALKAFLSMLTWFLKLFFSLLKYLYCFLPVTAVVFCGLYCLNTFLLISGSAGPDKISTEAITNEKLEQTAQDFLKTGNSEVGFFYKELVNWWKGEIGKYEGAPAFVFLLILSFVLLVPVVGVILVITVLASYGKILFFAVAADMAFYIGYAILGRGFMSVAQNRYYKMFPDAGKRKVVKDYARMKEEMNSLEAERENLRNEREGRAFYDEAEDYYSDDCIIRHRRHPQRDRYEEEFEEYEDEYYDDRNYDDRDYEQRGYEDDYDYDDTVYEDEYYEEEPLEDANDYDREPAVATAGAQGFDFFAGCKSRESAERKYKSLVKLYHPDNMDGDNGALQEINVQYDKVKKQFS